MDVLKVEKLTDEKWLNLFAARFRHDGREGRWVFASRRTGADPPPAPGRCDAVLIVPVVRERGRKPRLAAIREFRVPVGDYVVSFPAGLLEPGEGLEETVRRELLEETGLEVTAIKRVTPPLYSTSGMSDEAAAMAFVDCTSTPGGKTELQDSEIIEVLLLDYEEVCRMCDATDLRIDAKAWTTLYMYQQLGKLV
jgi:ADP-ribose pyrophosphatase